MHCYLLFPTSDNCWYGFIQLLHRLKDLLVAGSRMLHAANKIQKVFLFWTYFLKEFRNNEICLQVFSTACSLFVLLTASSFFFCWIFYPLSSPQREGVCNWFHLFVCLSVCLQSSIHSCQDIISTFSQTVDTTNSSSWFTFCENQVKVKVTLHYISSAVFRLHRSTVGLLWGFWVVLFCHVLLFLCFLTFLYSF